MSDEIDRWLNGLSPEARAALRRHLEAAPAAPVPLDAAPPVSLDDFDDDEPTSETFDGGVSLHDAPSDAALVASLPPEAPVGFSRSATFDDSDDLDASSAPTRADLGPAPTGSVPVELPPPRPAEAAPAARYTQLAVLGEGGMGMVLRVRDEELNRTVAMKILKPNLVKSPRALTRFREEAQIAAQLQHPGIIPVHDIGRRPDGSVYFTMKEVRGRTYEDVIDEVQIALEDGKQRTDDGWSFRRLIDTFHRVCETLAYAHHRGVVHRDLKPENIMVGAFGEVLVLDWGLAKVLAEEQAESDEGIVTDRSATDESMKTRMGAVAGTPSYMAPEQARGQIHKIDPTTDVYGLGGILYAILAGRTPYMASNVREMLDLVSEGEPITPPHRLKRTPGPVPVELSEIAMKALSHKQRDRYPEAGALAAEIATWLDGARKREKALEVLAEARDAAARVPELRTRAEALAEQGAAALAALPAGAPESARWPGWDLERAAESAREEAERTELEVVHLLRSALTHAPDIPEAHDALADHFHALHVQAESAGDSFQARRTERELRAYNRAGRFDRYLQGDGALTLLTDPPGARATLYRYVERHKRLVPERVDDLGETPIVERTLPRGSWVVTLERPGHHPVTYPVFIERLQHWDGIPPGEAAPFPIHLPRLGELADDDCYVPAGWFWSGARPEEVANPLPRRRLWCDAVVFKRRPVTVQEVLDCANDLLAQGREDEALRIVPRENGQNDQGELIVGRDADGRFVLVPDKDGDLWDPRWPVFMLSQRASLGYAAWRAARDGAPWRLPHELEWQKAARGVDGRLWPWGHRAEAAFSCNRAPRPPLPGEHAEDCSPYGMLWCVGGVQDRTRDPSPQGGPVRGERVVVTPPELDADAWVACGLDWLSRPHPLPHRVRAWGRTRYAEVGLRLARALGAADRSV